MTASPQWSVDELDQALFVALESCRENAPCFACGEPMRPSVTCSTPLCLNPDCWVDSNPKVTR